MRTKNRMLVALLLLASGAAACADLEVVNTVAPDRERTLARPEDAVGLVSAGYRNWWNVGSSYDGPMMFMSTASFQHSAYPANFVMVDYSKIPRIPINNNTFAGDQYSYFRYAWVQYYRAISGVAQGLQALEGVSLGSSSEDTRIQAYGKLVQGLAHGGIALLFDQGYIFDETMDLEEPQPLVPYTQVLEAALKYLDDAIAIASTDTFTIPADWMGRETKRDDLIKFAYSMKARYRANVARTPDERKAVDWDAVVADIDKGITEDWEMNLVSGSGWGSTGLRYAQLKGWGQLSYFVMGMADQSGKYQKWMSTPINSRTVTVDGEPFLIVTPDKRFPQGSTLAEQTANRGTLWKIPNAVGEQWARPDRGEWRWSYYNSVYEGWGNSSPWPVITVAELDLLRAEAHYHKGEFAQAAAIVNKYRTAAGLNATDASGTNTDCVPKLPNGECGDLWEMLKWEKRLETYFKGHMMNSWFFDGRGWGDLMEGTFLEFPVPALDLELEGLPLYTTGGVGGRSAAPVGTYGY